MVQIWLLRTTRWSSLQQCGILPTSKENFIERRLFGSSIPQQPHISGVLGSEWWRQANILCLTEQLPNSRPLTPNSNDPSKIEALTPDHFLLGRPSIAIPYLPDAQKCQNHRKMFWVAQAHKWMDNIWRDNIWAKWLKEYSPAMVQRTSAIGRKRPCVDYRPSWKTRFLPAWKNQKL